MIESRGLGRRFGGLVAVDGVSLRVEDGTLLALLGPNGAGKTTTVRMLSGLLAPSVGSATVAGRDVRGDPAGVRARIGLVTDVPGLYEQMTPAAYLDFFGRLYGLDEPTRARRIDALLELFELQSRRPTKLAEFSRGMQQKVALARGLLHEPAVLFLDEPTAGLDPLAARAVRELIVSLKHARRSIVLCTHDLDEAERLADQVAIMSAGRIVALDTPARLRAAATADTVVRISLATPHAAAPAGVLEFRTPHPAETNPEVIAHLVAAGAQIVSVTCTARTLEDVYAAALHSAAGADSLAVGAVGAVGVAAEESFARGETTRGASGAGGGWRRGLGIARLIAWRAALESLRDRLTALMNVLLAVVAPLVLLAIVVRPLASTLANDLGNSQGAGAGADTGDALAFYVLFIGLLPAVGAVGIAAGQFAGEKERGILTPLLASPASNLALFAGKVLGAVIPPLLYSVLAETIYLVGTGVLLGFSRLGLIPAGLSVAMLLLVPAATTLGAIVASIVSSRVRTFNAAQQIGGILLIPVWAILFALAANLRTLGPLGLFAAVAVIVGLDALLTVVAAQTWRREEVLSQR